MLLSCNTEKNDRIIASFNEKDLFLSEINKEFPSLIDDSTFYVEKFINDWVRHKILVSNAEMNLSASLSKYEDQISDYRESLLIYAYQQEILNQDFDTLISENDIKEYYINNDFISSNNIFKGRFIVIDKLAPNLDKLNRWFTSDNEVVIEKLEDYCQQFSKEYFINSKNWQYFSIINNKLPELINDEVDFLRNTKSFIFEDGTFKYYIFIKDYLSKGDRSPLAFEKEKIKDLLLNKKKIIFLKNFEEELYQNALSNNKIKIY